VPVHFIPLKIRDIRRRLYLHSVDIWIFLKKELHPYPYHYLRGGSHLLNENKMNHHSVDIWIFLKKELHPYPYHHLRGGSHLLNENKMNHHSVLLYKKYI